MQKLWILLITFALVIPTCKCQAGTSTTPVILIYSPKAAGYGSALKKIIEEDGRFSEARVRMCNRLEDFKVNIFFPDAKVAVITLESDVGQDLNSTLQWFFGKGGGLVGMGFAGSWAASLNASENVFPLFGNSYRSPEYNPSMKRFIMSLVKEEEDEISEGVPNFSIPQHKLILNFNPSTKRFEKKTPESGEYKVLFTESSTGAPAVIKYRDRGVSVAFATFGGDDVERSPSYRGLFVDQPEFKTLFTNSLFWVWNNEGKFQDSVEEAARYYREMADHIDEIAKAEAKGRKKAETARFMKTILVILGSGICCVVIYWVTFIRVAPSRSER